MYYPVDDAKITSEKKEFRAFSYGQKKSPAFFWSEEGGRWKGIEVGNLKKNYLPRMMLMMEVTSDILISPS